MRLLILLMVSFTLTACNKNLSEAHKSDECEAYFDFIKSQWLEVDNHFKFRVKPEYIGQTKEARAIRHKYFNQTCLIGLPKSKIRSIFGKPSVDVMFKEMENMREYTYCLDVGCFTKLYFFLKDDLVIQASPKPYDVEIDY